MKMGMALRILVFLLLAAGTSPIRAQQLPASDSSAPINKGELFKKFQETLSGAKLVGHFTILGRELGDLPQEEYTIESVQKMPSGDYWLFRARIQYMDKDVTLPLPLEVMWAGETPVISLTDLTIPVLGTFSARVVIHNDKYAGTWTHDKVGGHMFGTIEKIADEEGSQ
jgi:hypothetical protein